MFATNSCETIEAFFAISAIGATVVPMNYRAADEEVKHLLADSGSKVVFAETRYRELIERCRPDTPRRDHLPRRGLHRPRDGAEEFPLVVDVEDEELAALLYTSGTTSFPKGVKLTHGALSGYIMGANDAADGSDLGRMILAAPALSHRRPDLDAQRLCTAGRVTIVLSQFEAEQWLSEVETHQATHAFLVPTMLARVLDVPNFGSGRRLEPEALTYGAAPMPPAVIKRAIDMFPDTRRVLRRLRPDRNDLDRRCPRSRRSQARRRHQAGPPPLGRPGLRRRRGQDRRPDGHRARSGRDRRSPASDLPSHGRLLGSRGEDQGHRRRPRAGSTPAISATSTTTTTSS